MVQKVLKPLVVRASRVLRGRPPDVNILFLRMPKCGGSSIDRAIKRRFVGEKPVFTLRIAAAARAAALAGRKTKDLRRDLLLFQLASQPEGYISGHFPFSHEAWAEFHDRWKFVTVLRHPVDRWFSHYFYNRFKTHSDFERITDEPERFVETQVAERYGRVYVSQLSDNRDLDEALANLRRFDLVGRLERLPDFAERFRKMFGKPLSMGRRNENPLAAERQQQMITPEIRACVEELCQPDMRVYECACGLARNVAEIPVSSRGIDG